MVVRVRPLNAAERADRDATILQVEEGGQNLMVVVPGPRGAKLSRRFAFNACLPPSVSQPEVFSMVGVPQLLEAAMQGYACTVFAYGQVSLGLVKHMCVPCINGDEDCDWSVDDSSS